jgi:quercetin dioxygenase-like cupin family protein
VLSQDLHVVVLAGTLTVTVGSTYRELGPGSYVGIPKGVAHVLGCEAAGECRLLFHQGAAAEVTEKKP